MGFKTAERSKGEYIAKYRKVNTILHFHFYTGGGKVSVSARTRNQSFFSFKVCIFSMSIGPLKQAKTTILKYLACTYSLTRFVFKAPKGSIGCFSPKIKVWVHIKTDALEGAMHVLSPLGNSTEILKQYPLETSCRKPLVHNTQKLRISFCRWNRKNGISGGVEWKLQLTINLCERIFELIFHSGIFWQYFCSR